MQFTVSCCFGNELNENIRHTTIAIKQPHKPNLTITTCGKYSIWEERVHHIIFNQNYFSTKYNTFLNLYNFVSFKDRFKGTRSISVVKRTF